MGVFDDIGKNTDRELQKMKAKTQQIIAAKKTQGLQQQQQGQGQQRGLFR